MIHSADATSEFALAAPRVPSPAGLIPPVMVVAFALGTLLAAVLSVDFAGVVATLLLGAVLMAAWVLPLRAPLLFVMFVGLAVDRPGDTDGQWASAFQTIGGVLFQNLNKVIGVEALKFSGVFLLLVCLLLVRGTRVLSGRVADTPSAIGAAPPLRWGIVVAVVSLTVITIEGWLSGGDIQMAKIQVQAYLQLLAVAYLFSVSLRGTRDYQTAGKAIVAAACVKACMAIWVRMTVPDTYVNSFGATTELEYATNHGDSLLFACAIGVLAGPLLYQPRRRHLRWVLLAVPLIFAGLYANDRRIGWVQTAMMLAALAGMNYRRVLTPSLMRRAVWLVPLFVVYVVVGWSYPSRISAPVQLVRGLVMEKRTDGSVDRSTLYRDAENYNLVTTFRTNPVLGTGFGHPFDRVARLDDISLGFREFAYLPHNSILGLWAFGGAVGFTGIFALPLIAVFLAARAHAHAEQAGEAIAASAAIGCIGAYVLHAWGDIGFTEPESIFLVGLAVAIAGQTALSTGAWPRRWRSAIERH
ncbi:MAG TPA: O-antigen ligase family protein [Vicinamibacterales bacterium]|nr:O-antigen ligase family protein [Vicinamibacterales bacterium]